MTTLALLDASVGDTPAERNFRRELDADLDVFKVSEGEFPPSVSSSGWRYDGVVISGSQTSVYDDRDWIHEATEWVRRVHDADVLGGRVVDMGEYELGYRRVRRVGDDPLFGDLPREFTSFETHSDRVAELPAGAHTLAQNDYGVQAFRVGTTYGVQFHPEYDRETAEWVVRGKELPDDRIESVLAGITDETVADAEAATLVFDNLLSLVENHQPVRRAD
jgi:GMP synthase (glutamine-hydrolysing)